MKNYVIDDPLYVVNVKPDFSGLGFDSNYINKIFFLKTKRIMKRKGFLIEVVLGTEYERMSVVDPRTGTIVFEGSTSDAMEFLANEIASFKNQSEDEGK